MIFAPRVAWSYYLQNLNVIYSLILNDNTSARLQPTRDELASRPDSISEPMHIISVMLIIRSDQYEVGYLPEHTHRYRSRRPWRIPTERQSPVKITSSSTP